MTETQSALTVGILPLPRFTLNAFASFLDALRLAADERDRSRPIHCRWEVMSPTGRAIPASCGVSVSATAAYQPVERFDYLVVVGGLLGHDEEEEFRARDYLREAASAGVGLVGLCTGVFTMARAGLLEGRKACVSWLHYREMQEEFDAVELDATRLFIVDGKRITCAGGVGAARLAGWIIERHLGHDTARKALGIMMVDSGRAAAAPAQPQPPLAESVRNTRVARAIKILEENLSSPPRIDWVANQIGLSRRQLERGFQDELGMSFGAFSRRLRLDQGLWLILNSERSVLDITLECGFNGQSHFATLFRKTYGLSPSDARALSLSERQALLQQAARFGLSQR